MAKEKKIQAGKIDTTSVLAMLNKKAGYKVAYTLNQHDSPTEVKDWCSTGSRWLDSIICDKKIKAGIPLDGKFVEIAGRESTGKSFFCGLIAANAQKLGLNIVYFDSENAIDPSFLQKAGCNLDDGTFTYVQGKSIEFIFDSIETIITNSTKRFLFIIDSLTAAPCEAEIKGTYDPSKSMAIKPRVVSLAFKKLTGPLANHMSSVIFTSQLKVNFNQWENKVDPYIASGSGASPAYYSSLRIWLTTRRSKGSYIYDSNGFIVGVECKATLKKNRFGTVNRQCVLMLDFRQKDAVKVADEETWFLAIKNSERIKEAGKGWFSIILDNGEERKFQEASFLEKLRTEPEFYQTIDRLFDEEVIEKFVNREGKAKNYKVDEDDDENINQYSTEIGED